jgi:hypothetical protein
LLQIAHRLAELKVVAAGLLPLSPLPTDKEKKADQDTDEKDPRTQRHRRSIRLSQPSINFLLMRDAPIGCARKSGRVQEIAIQNLEGDGSDIAVTITDSQGGSERRESSSDGP